MMTLGNCNPANIQSWYDFAHICPKDPMELITDAKLNSVQGVYLDSGTMLDPPGGTWTANTAQIGTAPVITANGTDSQQKVEDAVMWNFRHLTKSDNTAIAPALEKLIFLRAGRDWTNTIQIDFGGTTYTDIQLTFRNNSATRGDKQGTVPVISFTGSSWTGTQDLEVILLKPGLVQMGMRLIDNSSNWYYFEMEWNIVR